MRWSLAEKLAEQECSDELKELLADAQATRNTHLVAAAAVAAVAGGAGGAE